MKLEQTVYIIGHSAIGRTCSAYKDFVGKNQVILIDPHSELPVDDKTISINGVLYSPVEVKNESNYSRRYIPSTAFDDPFNHKVGRKLKTDINIVKEFELIQLKQSKLSVWERTKVVEEFYKQYKKT